MNDVISSSPGSEGEFLFYTAPDGAVKVEVFCRDETVWLTQKALAALFGVQVPAIAKHLKNIFDSGELQEVSVVSILETTAADAKNYQTRYYNLDAIIAGFSSLTASLNCQTIRFFRTKARSAP